MSKIFERICELVERYEVLISEHGYDELAEDDIFVEDILIGINNAVVLEESPDYHKGPCVLVLQKDTHGKPIHVVWGIPKGASTPAVLITAYRPNPQKWSDDFKRRRK